jgi:AraC-like DNA-binding protein
LEPRVRISRRLAAKGTTYEEVVDQLRRSLALQYIKDPGMSLGEMTWLLGYEGSTSFNHAFKRWTGLSPSAANRGSHLLHHKFGAASGIALKTQSPTALKSTKVKQSCFKSDAAVHFGHRRIWG